VQPPVLRQGKLVRDLLVSDTNAKNADHRGADRKTWRENAKSAIISSSCLDSECPPDSNLSSVTVRSWIA
jgi:hypothetical protein